MKVIYCLMTLILFHSELFSQKNDSVDTCTLMEGNNINVFIPGYIDTVVNGMNAQAIDTRSLSNGFELSCNDVNVKIISFQLIFGFDQGWTWVTSRKNKIEVDKGDELQYSKILQSPFILIDHIKIEYKGKCYSLRGKAYTARAIN